MNFEKFTILFYFYSQIKITIYCKQYHKIY